MRWMFSAPQALIDHPSALTVHYILKMTKNRVDRATMVHAQGIK